MRLISVEIHGYKRFAEPEKMNLDGKVVAIVGPNGAGKTSFIEGLEHLETDEAFAAEDLTRGITVPEDQAIVEALYLLDEGDLEAIANLHGAPTGHTWFRIQKDRNGERSGSLEPALARDVASRNAVVESLRTLLRSPWLAAEIEEPPEEPQPEGEEAESRPLAPSAIDEVLQGLEADRQSLSAETVEALSAAVERLEALEGGPQYAAGTISQLRRVYEHEASAHPQTQALRIMWDRRPELIPFDSDARGLRYEYDLAVDAESPPLALENLAGVAALDLVALRSAIETGETGTAAHLLEQANERLLNEYGSWTQSGVRPRFDRGDALLLHVHVSREAGGYMKFNEQSAGLRTYVALVATATTKTRDVQPVFVVDEAELHLHYDAQADLLEVFTTQDAVAQVVYTTHSAGCLPEDLGSGVRIIEPIPETNHSRIRNKFWTTTRASPRCYSGWVPAPSPSSQPGTQRSAKGQPSL